MPTVGVGPLVRIDGPPPLRPIFGLLQAAEAPAAGVQIIPDADATGVERWGNGAEVYPYPPSSGHSWDPCSAGSSRDKLFGDEADLGDNPEFGAFTAYVEETCKTYKVWDQTEYVQRAVAVFNAIESSIVAREFMAGVALRSTSSRFLADGVDTTFPNGDTATSFPDGMAYLEQAVARTGRQGVIHLSPQILTAAAARYGWNYWHDEANKVIRMISGTVIVPDAGYADGATPNGHAQPAGATQEWIYATGPVDVRRSSRLIILPERAEEAVERGTAGASTGRPNTYTYRVERDYLVSWDAQLHAAVLVDRCTDDCSRGTPS